MKNKIFYFFKSVGLLLLLLFFTTFFFLLIGIEPGLISENKFILYSFISNILLLIIFITIYFKDLKRDFKLYISNITNNIKLSFKYWFVGFIIMILSNLLIIFFLNKGIAGNEQEVRKLVNMFPIYMIFNTVIYAPLTEELIFRKSIKDFINNKYLYILTSGLIFGLLHIISYIKSPSDLLYLIPYSSLGIVFASLYYKTENIFSTITIHAFHNILALIFVFIGELV